MKAKTVICEVPIEDYCAHYCPQRYESECFVLCHLEQEEREEYDDDDRDDAWGYDEDMFDEDDFPR